MPELALYDLPPLYDQVVAPGPCEIFYGEEALRAGGPVLELACGTGRLTIPIAARGHEVVGLDASPAMLEAARAKAAEAGADATFLEGDMREFALERRFALIIISCNSLAHLTSHEELKACLDCVRRHLAPGGTFALDVMNPNIHILARSPDEIVRISYPPHADEIIVEEKAFYDPVWQVRTSRWSVRQAGGSLQELLPFRLRQFFPQELSLLFEASGLSLVQRYGDFERSAFCGQSLNQVCLVNASCS